MALLHDRGRQTILVTRILDFTIFIFRQRQYYIRYYLTLSLECTYSSRDCERKGKDKNKNSTIYCGGFTTRSRAFTSRAKPERSGESEAESVTKLPQTTSVCFARVSATLRRWKSERNPTRPRGLLLTQLQMTYLKYGVISVVGGMLNTSA